MEEGHIFISYSRKDRKKVDWIARQLVGSGFKVWIDRHDIPGGEEWAKSILKAIISAETFLIVLSPNSIKSTEVNRELDAAIKNEKRIIPLILQPIDMNWLAIKDLSKLQIITYYRRRQSSIVDLVNNMGGLRGVASVMPSDSNLVIRENTKLIAELIRIIQEVGFGLAHVIFKGGEDWQYYIQLVGTRDEPEISAEAVSNLYLEEHEKLDDENIASLIELGWQKPIKKGSGNYWNKWQVHTNRDRAAVAAIIMNTFLKSYRHLSGEHIVVTEIDLDQ